MANCYACKAEIVFDNEHIGKNGKKIPLDPATHQPHDCPMREKVQTTSFIPAEEKNDHGNESFTPTVTGKILEQGKETTELKSFVDHTAKGVPRFIAFESTSADLLTKHANDWVDEQGDKIQVKLIGQLQVDNGKFAIALYYEEVAK